MGLLVLAVVAALSGIGQADVVVSPSGSDGNPGTEEQPVATLERARTLLRTQGGGTAWLRGGTHHRTTPLILTAEDSNTTWRGWPDEEVRITGGRVVTGFRPLQTRPGVYSVDLRSQGITDFGRLTPRGFGRPIRPAALELFFRGEPMPPAAWPNAGWAYTSAAPGGPDGGQFSVNTSRLARWVDEPDLWVHGYWTWDWADSYEHVAGIDVERRILKTDPPHGVYGYAAPRRFRVLNALSELDQPGEWYLDRAAGVLSFWPPAELRDGDVIVSLLEGPLVSITNAANVRLLELTLEVTRGNGVEIRGGRECVVAHCILRNIGNTAVTISGGAGNGVEDCDISQTGDGAVTASGGDRRALTPSAHFVTGNNIQRFSRWVRTYRPAVSISGVGQQVLRNRIHHAPHMGIALSGNDHLIEGNDIHTTAWETADVGAFYMGRDWTWQGNVLRANFFHNQGNGDVNSVYLDDCASGTLVEGNIFHRAGRSVFIGGGRDNTVRNNLFIDGNPAVEVDARGLTWAYRWFNGEDPTLMDRLKQMPYKTPPWSERYPKLVNILDDEPAIPKGNIVENNVSWLGRWQRLRDWTEKWVVLSNNWTETDPGFVDAARNDFRLREDSPVYAAGFVPLAYEDLGDTGDVVNYRLEAVAGTTPGKLRLVVENLGRTAAAGEILLWAWPEQVQAGDGAPVHFDLDPAAKLTRELEVRGVAGLTEYWVGARRRGDDVRPMGLRVTPPK
ncbi:MAG: right-handed parallel beta-helix repeat-containing protein [Acidobacteria bacterium]|nr:right-handed parallel beta-helix repeat-containing protein [Acidobacteriota bacterium]